MSDTKDYTIDNEPVTWTELIKRAEDDGCYFHGGIKQTSVAANYLRTKGHKISNNSSTS